MTARRRARFLVAGCAGVNEERTDSNKQKAISYAAYRAAVDLLPADRRAVFDPFMLALGYDPQNNAKQRDSPEGIGNLACDAVLAKGHHDGANQTAHVPYADDTGYVAHNPTSRVPINPAKIIDPDRFQPLEYEDKNVQAAFGQIFLGAQWFRVIAFAGPYEKILAITQAHFPVARYGSKEFEAQARELIDISANLTDEQKVISEYWTDGPHSELPPGHWALFAAFVSQRDHHSLDDDAKMFFALTNAVADAGIAAWTLKRRVDSVRPITAIPYLFRGHPIACWAGPGKGTQTMDGAEWMSYQPLEFPTPPFPEYPSGHSAFSAAAARTLELWTGNERFEASTTIAAASSRIEPNITPAFPITLHWPTFRDAADQAGISRRYGGLHFQTGDLAGRELGRLVAERVWHKATSYFEGK